MGGWTCAESMRNSARVLRGWDVEVDVLDRNAEPLDIRIRDWGCVEGVFFRYDPDYAKDVYTLAGVTRAQRALRAAWSVAPLRATGA